MKLYSNITYFFCIWALAILAIFYFGFSTLPHTNLFPNDFLKSLANWDGGHFLGIADGYDKYFQYAFFPLYPVLINLVSKLTGSLLTAGILISTISTLLAANFLYKLVVLEFGKQHAQKAVLAMLFFPMSFYLLTVYSEALFLFLAIATFYFARKRRLLLASITAALASATRLAGLGVVLGLFINVYLSGGLNRKNWYILLAPLGFILYSLYLYQNTGDLFYFVRAEKYWHRQLVFPGSAIFSSFGQLLTPGFIAQNFRAFWDFAFTIFGVGLVWRVARKLSIDYAVFSIISLMLPLFSPTLLAVPRYLLTIFPIFIVMSQVKNQYVIFAYSVLSLLLLAGFAILFITGNWVT